MENHGITGYGDTIEDVKIENMSKDELETHKQALIKTIIMMKQTIHKLNQK